MKCPARQWAPPISRDTIMRDATAARRIARILLTISLASLGIPGLAQDGPAPLPPTACGDLQNLSIPASAIGLPTSGAIVQTAAPVSASAKDNPNGDFCKVTGIVKTRNAGS